MRRNTVTVFCTNTKLRLAINTDLLFVHHCSHQQTSIGEGCVKMSDPWTKNDRLYGQNFKKLQATHLKSKSLFEDPHFPPNSSSLSYSGNVEGDSARLGKGKKTVGKKLHKMSTKIIGKIGNDWMVV